MPAKPVVVCAGDGQADQHRHEIHRSTVDQKRSASAKIGRTTMRGREHGNADHKNDLPPYRWVSIRSNAVLGAIYT
jgi:hypothetical protein